MLKDIGHTVGVIVFIGALAFFTVALYVACFGKFWGG